MKNHVTQKKPTEAANRINGSPPSNGRLERGGWQRLSLSSRQIEIAGLVALGLTDKEVANQLHLTEGTVGWYLNEIFKKRRIHSRTMLVAQFIQDAGQRIPRSNAP